MEFADKLEKLLPEGQVLFHEPMGRHTTFQVGGEADYFVQPMERQVAPVIRLCREEGVPFQVVGNGSNLLVSDKGYRGLILAIGANMGQMELEGSVLTAQAGAMLSSAAALARREGKSGLEFASGIPGTIGGALYMNARAYGGEMKDLVKEVHAVTRDGRPVVYTAETYAGGYRTSVVRRDGAIVLSASFALKEGTVEEITARMQELRRRRQEKQPLEYPSAGSTFKRPKGDYAGRLIEVSGLQGFQIGGAQVSEKHCGFVINKGGATAQDIWMLMQHVIRTVKEKQGVVLEPEVCCIGSFEDGEK